MDTGNINSSGYAKVGGHQARVFLLEFFGYESHRQAKNMLCFDVSPLYFSVNDCVSQINGHFPTRIAQADTEKYI